MSNQAACRFCLQRIFMGKLTSGPEYIPLDPPEETAVYLFDVDTQKMSDPPATKTRLVCADHRRTCPVLRSAEFRYLNDETKGRLFAMVMTIPEEDGLEEGTRKIHEHAVAAMEHGFDQAKERFIAANSDPAVTEEVLVDVVASLSVEGACCSHPLLDHPNVEGETFCVAPGCACTAWRK